ncbi:MAG: hypothetical protein QN141_03095 [Armatimonadota bacterium]|nr:hypothetical protein [Armatimonadota bacterium]MDR7452059.1 hypothetical protein [Armatimonadota bacterium]MDR7466521.1 hypothetical protein [Armatimonadota bacterium]MDR7493243.1 hypothetical protein [Armatimonadota bacterium]MDR7499864.1 hypothetical protein [Armatimonadota bacterium]
MLPRTWFLAVLVAATTPLALSDPIAIAETTVAVPPALVAADGVVHLFWIHRPPGYPRSTGELWHAVVATDGRPLGAPSRLATAADTRFAWPAAERLGSRLWVAWMERQGDALRVRVTLLDQDGRTVKSVGPGGREAEEGGRVSLLASEGILHLAWSQFDSGRRRIWYARLRADGEVDLPARAVAQGEAPALAIAEGVRLLWWHPAGGGNHVLRMAAPGGPGGPEELTGRLLLVHPLPPIPLPVGGGIDVLVPTTERAFRTSGQLYLVRVRGNAVTARLPLSRGRSMADVAAAAVPGAAGGLVVWQEAAGRRQNAEIFGAAFDPAAGQLTAVTRLTYTPAGSIRPAIVIPAGGPVLAWLETLDIARFRVVLGTAQRARPRAFLLGVPELDLRRPVLFVTFALTALAATLPYAALFTAIFGLGALAVLLLAGAVLGGFSWWDDFRRRIGVSAFLVVVAVLQISGRAVIPGRPDWATLAGTLLLFGGPGVLWGARRRGASPSLPLIAAAAAVGLQMIAVLFPWAAGQLSQF